MADCVGQQLGKYHLVRFLGRGGFGDVYLGEHVEDGTQAAIKVLHEPLTNENIKEFVNEAGLCQLLRHEYIVRLLDIGIRDDYVPFLAMEYAPNGSLADRHPRGTQLPLDTIISYVKPISAALQYAHDKGLIHRDVKPANFLVGTNGKVLLGDFGIVAIALSTRSLEQQREKQKVVGSWEYAAPEQFKGKAVTASDQYSLAVVVYEWLCRERPFHGNFNQLVVQHYHLNTPPPPLHEKMSISPAVEQVIMKALEKDPKNRFPTIQAFAEALEQAVNASQQDARVSQQPPPILPSLQPHRQPSRAPTLQSNLQAIPLPSPQPQLGSVNQQQGGWGVQNPAQQGGWNQQQQPAWGPQNPAQPQQQNWVTPAYLPIQPVPPQLPTPFQPETESIRRSRTRVLLTWGVLVLLILAGIVWVAISHSQLLHPLIGIAWSGSRFVAVGGSGTILTSPNGSAWTAQTSGTSQGLRGVAWSGSRFVAVGDTILTSPNGSTWTTQTSGTSQGLEGVAWSGSRFVAVGGNTILTSPDGSTWTTQISDTSQYFLGVAWLDSRFIAVGESGTILTSPDGSTWTTQISDTSQELRGVAWSGSRFVAVGGNGTILTSPDGNTWTAQASSTSQELYGVAWSGSRFVAVGNYAILTSLDGNTWTAQASGTSQFLSGVAWSDSRFVAVGWGWNREILTSPDGSTWTTQT